jgi:hypothetical protein
MSGPPPKTDLIDCLDIEHDDFDVELITSRKQATPLKDFITDFKNKIPTEVTTIKLFVFTDRTSIYENRSKGFIKYTFTPCRINLLAHDRPIGFMSITRLLSVYGEDLSLSLYESRFAKLDRNVNINMIQVELTPKLSRTHKEYLRIQIMGLYPVDQKAIDTLINQYYELTPNAKLAKSNTSAIEFSETVTEYMS